MIDYAHNEAGMSGLTEETARACAPSGNEVWLAICTAGDRTDAILRAFAFRAAVGSDHLAVAELVHYLRGRSREDIVDRAARGRREAAASTTSPCYPDELTALTSRCWPTLAPGDVVGRDRARDAAGDLRLARGAGARRLGPADVRKVVRRAASRPVTRR